MLENSFTSKSMYDDIDLLYAGPRGRSIVTEMVTLVLEKSGTVKLNYGTNMTA